MTHVMEMLSASIVNVVALRPSATLGNHGRRLCLDSLGSEGLHFMEDVFKVEVLLSCGRAHHVVVDNKLGVLGDRYQKLFNSISLTKPPDGLRIPFLSCVLVTRYDLFEDVFQFHGIRIAGFDCLLQRHARIRWHRVFERF